MDENIKQIEEVMTFIDKDVNALKEYPVSNNDHFKNLCYSLGLLDLEFDKVFKPINYKRRIKN